jgi:hypothetical protein
MISIIIVVHWASFGGSLAWHDVRRFRCPTRASPGPPLAASTEPKPCSADSFKSRATFVGGCALAWTPNQG